LPKNLRVDETNVSSGNAGMLPRATASVTDNNSVQNLNQTRIDGTENSLNNAKNNSLSICTFRLDNFDGLRMFARKEQLKELQN
jgi:hypothetical protein